MGSWTRTPTPAQARVRASNKPAEIMDAIRKKMQSLKGETDGLYATIRGFEEATKEATGRADQADCDIRDYGKKVQSLEIAYDETNDKLTKATESLEEADKQFKEVEGDVAALTRRIMLMEEEDKKSADTLCNTITKLAVTSKTADNVLKAVKVVESTCMNNEVTIEELDKNLRATIKMAVDNEQKLDELFRKPNSRGDLKEQNLLRRTLRELRKNLKPSVKTWSSLKNLLKRLSRGKRSWLRRSFLFRTSTRLLRPDLSTEKGTSPSSTRELMTLRMKSTEKS